MHTTRLLSVCLLLAGLVSALLFAPREGVQATFPGANGKIAFTRDRGATWGISTIEPDGTNEIDGEGNASEPAWAADGSKMAFRTFGGGIGIMYADGTNLGRIIGSPSYEDAEPTWSPDGSMITFASSRDTPAFSFRYHIYVANADGSNQTQLTNIGDPGTDRFPSWSPDGSRIAFIRWTGDGTAQIYVMNPDGTNQSRLTSGPSISYHRPSWSPDGSKIAAAALRDGNEEILVMNSDGSGSINVSNNPALDSYPAWSPDGSKIAFISNRDGNQELYVMNADGTNLTRLTSDADSEREPDWQPLVPPSPTPTSTLPATPPPTFTATAMSTRTPTPAATPSPPVGGLSFDRGRGGGPSSFVVLLASGVGALVMVGVLAFAARRRANR